MKHAPLRAGFEIAATLFLFFLCLSTPASAQRHQQPAPTGPWMNASLSPDERADLVLKEMTLDEKVALLARRGHADR